MRIEGTLAKWNHDRGFGFITQTQDGPEVFAHISAFPKDGQRPGSVSVSRLKSESAKMASNRLRTSCVPNARPKNRIA